MATSAPQAATELLLRQRMRDDLVEYARAVPVPGRPLTDAEDSAFAPIETVLGEHHILLLRAWQRMTETPFGRLMVLMPPGSAKSTYASVVGPAWWLSKDAGRRCILCSYGDDLARKHGRRTKQLIKDERHGHAFEVSLSADSHASDEFALTNGSEYMSGGILGGVTGNRAGGLVIDDPYKNREDADSDTMRNKIQDEYDDSLTTRLTPGAWVCIIQTRWHEDDLAGRILPKGWKGGSGDILCRDGQVWHVICLQAQCDVGDDPLGRKKGEYLWPQWFTERHWAQYKTKARTWAALYQQLPNSEEGDYFKRTWFRRYRELPKYVHTYATSDHAPAGNSAGDSNVGQFWAMDHNGDIFLDEFMKAQCTMDKFTDWMLPRIKDKDPLCWFPEGDNNWKAIAGFVAREMVRLTAYCRVEPITPHGSDKEVKAQAFQGLASQGKVWVREGPEGDEAINEWCKFPSGGKDFTDAAGVLGRAIDQAHEAIIPVVPDVKPRDRWDKAFEDDDEGGESWLTA